MLTHSRQTRARLLQVGDGGLFALALMMAYVLRATFPFLRLAHIDQWSLWLDAKILIATLPVVLVGRGAR